MPVLIHELIVIMTIDPNVSQLNHTATNPSRQDSSEPYQRELTRVCVNEVLRIMKEKQER